MGELDPRATLADGAVRCGVCMGSGHLREGETEALCRLEEVEVSLQGVKGGWLAGRVEVEDTVEVTADSA